jgi:methyl-accepting chemotaxis protein
VIFVAAILGSWALFSPLLQRHAEDEIAYRATLLMETLNAVRTYTSQHVNPLLAERLQSEDQFISQSVPAFSAATVFQNFQGKEGYENFRYKEAAPNPTNPRDLADPFEAQLVSTFRGDSSIHELSGFTMRDGEQVFYIARPMSVSAESCLACHSDPQTAPASLINTYGTGGGFGWQLGEIIAAQTIYLPASDVFQQAQNAVTLVMGTIVLIFAVVIVMTNVALRRQVIRPIVRIARLAQLIGGDKLTPAAPELATVNAIATRTDEFGHTAKVIQRMANEIYEREQKLKQTIQSLQIQIDKERESQEVAQITDSDYFQNLQQRVQQIRQRADTPKDGAQAEPTVGE